MTNFRNLPFEKLLAYQEARKLLEAMREAAITDSRLRDQALRAATSVCLNISEGAGRSCGRQGSRLRYCARRKLRGGSGAGHRACRWDLQERTCAARSTSRARCSCAA